MTSSLSLCIRPVSLYFLTIQQQTVSNYKTSLTIFVVSASALNLGFILKAIKYYVFSYSINSIYQLDNNSPSQQKQQTHLKPDRIQQSLINLEYFINYKNLMDQQKKTVFMKKPVLYAAYRNLDPKIKRQRIDEAQQSEADRKPNPQGNCEFDQYSFIDFHVTEGKKQIRLETYRQNARGKIIGVVFMFHGLNSYMGHGAHLAKCFSQHGLTTVGFDHRGFGRSQGREGYVENLQAHLADSKKFISLVMPMYKNLPKFVLGLSMGGMTSYYLTLQNPKLFDGAILMAPALKNNVGGTLVKVTKMLGSILPNKTRLTKPVYGKASKNPTITQFIKSDKYAFSQRMSLSTIQMIITTMDKAPKTFPLYKQPFMIIQGGLDKLVNPEVAFQLYDKSQTPQQDKELLFYQNMWHDIWHQEQIHQIVPKIVRWIDSRITKINLEKGTNLESVQPVENVKLDIQQNQQKQQIQNHAQEQVKVDKFQQAQQQKLSQQHRLQENQLQTRVIY